MAYISYANGNLTLEGGWTREDLDALRPVLACWRLCGGPCVQPEGAPALDGPRIGFFGSGRCAPLSEMLADLDGRTRARIKSPDGEAPLTAGQYDQLLRRMAEGALSILLAFEEWESENVDEDGAETEDEAPEVARKAGRFASDGGKLVYEALSWEELFPGGEEQAFPDDGSWNQPWRPEEADFDWLADMPSGGGAEKA